MAEFSVCTLRRARHEYKWKHIFNGGTLHLSAANTSTSRARYGQSAGLLVSNRPRRLRHSAKPSIIEIDLCASCLWVMVPSPCRSLGWALTRSSGSSRAQMSCFVTNELILSAAVELGTSDLWAFWFPAFHFTPSAIIATSMLLARASALNDKFSSWTRRFFNVSSFAVIFKFKLTNFFLAKDDLQLELKFIEINVTIELLISTKPMLIDTIRPWFYTSQIYQR